ncbi:DinB family protein [uncultured Paludibaculum sp.]|uniref:DinB family protein n=1 Tax=uncultured Paludibaculum sp. TaxID=1765020 RepID=UPI002AAB3DB4|nr:DinB family protein [uncultured Paludibaculum sp.]
MNPELALLLESIDEAFDRKSWHGPNLRGALRGVTCTTAQWRPAPGRHSIWELTLHCAYWKYVGRRRLTGEKRGSFPLQGSNFFPIPEESTEAAWKHSVNLLVAQHQDWRAAVTRATRLDARKIHLIRGVAAHDLYHAGQIQLLKRMQP